ncbi:MAG TPA: hypothetical protein VF725_14785 [Ktedonobacterales bacterium]
MSDQQAGGHGTGAGALARIARSVASMADIPWEELPDGAARGCLLEMAYKGADVYAYCGLDGVWYVWVEGRTETCAAWAARFSI